MPAILSRPRQEGVKKQFQFNRDGVQSFRPLNWVKQDAKQGNAFTQILLRRHCRKCKAGGPSNRSMPFVASVDKTEIHLHEREKMFLTAVFSKNNRPLPSNLQNNFVLSQDSLRGPRRPGYTTMNAAPTPCNLSYARRQRYETSIARAESIAEIKRIFSDTARSFLGEMLGEETSISQDAIQLVAERGRAIFIQEPLANCTAFQKICHDTPCLSVLKNLAELALNGRDTI